MRKRESLSSLLAPYPRGVHAWKVSPEQRHKLVARLKRAEGRLGAVRRMMENDDDCGDVFLQLSAVRGVWGRIGERVLSSPIGTCVAPAFASNDDTRRQPMVQQMVSALMEVFTRYGSIGAR